MTMRDTSPLSRREFLGRTGTCGAYLSALAAFGPAGAFDRLLAAPRFPIRAQEPWGRLEEISPSVWVLISTPLEDRTTLCNGGIVAGSRGTLVVEGFGSPRGAEWMAEEARRLTGRWPTHVVLTHYHGDHTGGVEGFGNDGAHPRTDATAHTRDRVVESDAGRDPGPSEERSRILADVNVLPHEGTTELDLGDRAVRFVSRDGHTGSDVSVELESPSVCFCGDLVWNGMFPNYMDAIPTRLSASVRDLAARGHTTYVPGHGGLAGSADMTRYLAVIDSVEAAARSAHERGVPPEEAASDFTLPGDLGEWMLFNPRYFEVAFSAWHRELGG